MDNSSIEYVRDRINTGVQYMRFGIGDDFTIEITVETRHSRLLMVYHDKRFPTKSELKVIADCLGIGSIEWNLASVDDGLPDAFSAAASVVFDIDDGGLSTTREHIVSYD